MTTDPDIFNYNLYRLTITLPGDGHAITLADMHVGGRDFADAMGQAAKELLNLMYGIGDVNWGMLSRDTKDINIRVRYTRTVNAADGLLGELKD